MADWYFKIESYTIDSFGHLYGTIYNTANMKDKNLEEFRIIRNVTSEDLHHPDFETYKPGDVTVRFYEREDLMNAMVQQWEAIADEGDRLLSFTDWYRDTGEVLAKL